VDYLKLLSHYVPGACEEDSLKPQLAGNLTEI
jgi:hypothetical protein